MIREGIQKLIEGTSLTPEESREVVREVMSGKATDAQTAAFLTALRMKGETVDELIAFASVMREHCRQIRPSVGGRLVDTCGTGGDKIKTFNISTAAAFVVAGAGIAIAKHGNRSVTSCCGSADVLEKLGLNLNMKPEAVQRTIEQVGVGFMFAPTFHPAMKHASAPRKEIGIRTIFNVLGPLTNPASANAQLLGVYDQKLTEPLAYALKRLGCEEAMVVHGLDGLDEISTVGKTAISWLREGEVASMELAPNDFGVKQAQIADISGTAPDESAEALFRILTGHCSMDDAKVEIVLVNSAAGIIVGGEAEDFSYGMESARRSIESGAAYKKLKALIKVSDGDLAKLEELEAKYE
ncbi:anthranilate phosphoribosyltransferase [Candidatus Bathyarchaeota archaeon A05DMB-2]|jgi:anthranilate phosphoribosyltransferase|nr:anthranilate phosphoribosyltransferase [Candidatus Bathyarchaeota archaeon A05DMB-2]